MEVWSQRPLAKKNNLYMEEWLTGKSVISISFFSQFLNRISRKVVCKVQAPEEGRVDKRRVHREGRHQGHGWIFFQSDQRKKRKIAI